MKQETADRIAAALERIADTLWAATIGSGEYMPTPSTPEPEVDEIPSIDDVRQALIAIGPKGKQLLQQHGCEKLSELDPGTYRTVITEAEAA